MREKRRIEEERLARMRYKEWFEHKNTNGGNQETISSDPFEAFSCAKMVTVANGRYHSDTLAENSLFVEQIKVEHGMPPKKAEKIHNEGVKLKPV